MRTLILILAIFLSINNLQSQIPALEVQDASGDTYQLTEYMDDESNYLVSFWATWCSPCKREYDSWIDYAENWETEANVKILGISIDSPNGHDKAFSTWDTKGWYGDVLIAETAEAEEAFSFQTIPQVFLFDNSGNLIYEHSGYINGDEIELDEFITSYFTLGTSENTTTPAHIKITQDASNLYISKQHDFSFDLITIYTLDGRLLPTKNVNVDAEQITIEKYNLVTSQMCVLEVSNKNRKETQLVYIK